MRRIKKLRRKIEIKIEREDVGESIVIVGRMNGWVDGCMDV